MCVPLRRTHGRWPGALAGLLLGVAFLGRVLPRRWRRCRVHSFPTSMGRPARGRAGAGTGFCLHSCSRVLPALIYHRPALRARALMMVEQRPLLESMSSSAS